MMRRMRDQFVPPSKTTDEPNVYTLMTMYTTLRSKDTSAPLGTGRRVQPPAGSGLARGLESTPVHVQWGPPSSPAQQCSAPAVLGLHCVQSEGRGSSSSPNSLRTGTCLPRKITSSVPNRLTGCPKPDLTTSLHFPPPCELGIGKKCAFFHMEKYSSALTHMGLIDGEHPSQVESRAAQKN